MAKKRRRKVESTDPLPCPFTILVDSAETNPWTFGEIISDADNLHREIILEFGQNLQWQSLGRYPESFGDYSIEGSIGDVAIERKSRADLESTLLGFADGHRKRFESELANLAGGVSAVIVESSLSDLVTKAAAYGEKPAKLNGKILLRSVISLMQEHNVQWIFCDSRRMAEVAAFRWLWRFWKENLK
jgi:hypothetical protein